ncbi:MAG: pilin [Patescibacteria group bacterium]
MKIVYPFLVLIIVFTLTQLIITPMALAQYEQDCGGGLCNPLGDTNDISDLIHKIVNWLVTLSAPIAVGMIVWGAFQMIFAAGDPEKFKTGKKTILYTLIGYAIILIGWGITSIITNFFKS